MTNNTLSGAIKHRESTEPESHQTAKMFFWLQTDQICTHIIPQNGASILGNVKLLGGSVGGMEWCILVEGPGGELHSSSAFTEKLFWILGEGREEDLCRWKCVCPFSSANLKTASKQWHMRHHLQHVLPTKTQRSITHTHTHRNQLRFWAHNYTCHQYTWQLHHTWKKDRKIVVNNL